MNKKLKHYLNKKLTLTILSSAYFIFGFSMQNNVEAMKPFKKLFSKSSSSTPSPETIRKNLMKYAYKKVFNSNDELSLEPYKSLIDENGNMQIRKSENITINPLTYYIEKRYNDPNFI